MINRNDYTPLYTQLYEVLKGELVNYPIGTNIPPERVLCEKYNLDRITVRKALAQLAEEGYIERKQGRGTRVLCHENHKNERVLFLLCQGSHMIDRRGEPFYARSLDALENHLQKMEKHLLYSKVFDGDDLSRLCDGLNAQAVILAGKPSESILEQCRKLGIPVIGYNAFLSDFPSVVIDNDAGAAQSAQYLWSQGHREIGFIRVPGYSNSDKRLSRFKSELRNVGMEDGHLHIAAGDWSEESGYNAAKELLSADGPRITALFCSNDSMAIGAMRAAQDMGLDVPRDLSVIGFDGIAQSELTSPPLTTSQVDARTMAEAACMLLNHVIENGMNRSIHALVSTQFIVRGSTASPNLKEE